MSHSQNDALQRDANDPFKALTHLFDMPLDKKGQPAIYLNGNSLGPKPKSIEAGLTLECERWKRLGGRAHFDDNEPWLSFHESVTPSLARLLGAKPEEVTAAGSLTVNLHLLFVSFYRPTRERFKIIRLAGFPSDTYALASQVKQRWQTLREFTGVDPFPLEEAIIEIKPNEQGYIDANVFKQALEKHGSSTAVVWFEAVHYLTGQYFDVPEITRLAQAKGCKVGWDLAHAIGNVPLDLHDWNVDFAVWCSYKYLSSGPGAIAGFYLHEKYVRDTSMLRLAGWWGHNKSTRFKMPPVFDPIQTAEGWHVSNSSILSLVALREALKIFDHVDLLALREKNKRLVSYLENLIREKLPREIQMITPSQPDERGCQLSFRMTSATKNIDLEDLFFDHGIICDVRGDLVRVAPMGLYSTFNDVFQFVERLASLVKGFSA